MNTEYEKQLNTLKQIKMTAIEKTEIRDSLTHFMASHPPVHKPIISRFFTREKFILSPYTGISMTIGKVIAFAFIGLILTGGSITMASANSIPGELLYPIKIGVKEKIEEVGKTSSKEKLAFKSKKVERRLQEIKQLSEKKDITKEEVTIAQAVLAEHVQELTETVTELTQSGEQDVILASSAELIPLTESLSTTAAVMTTLVADTTDTTTATLATTQETPQIETKIEDTTVVETKVDPTIPDVSTITSATNQVDLKAILSNEVEKQITEIKKAVQEVAQDVEDKKVEETDKKEIPVIDTPPIVNPEIPKKEELVVPDMKKDIIIEEPIKDTLPPVTQTTTTTTKDSAPKKTEQKSFFKR